MFIAFLAAIVSSVGIFFYVRRLVKEKTEEQEKADKEANKSGFR